MRIAVLTANLGNFDTLIDSVPQRTEHEVVFHRFTDENFPPITGLTPRMQYRIPKLFGYEMLPGFDVYIWLDGSFSMQHDRSVDWFNQQLDGCDAAFFKHPQRETVAEEVLHIEEKLIQGNQYIVSRYKNGLHKEQYDLFTHDEKFRDNTLYTSTAFIYRNNSRVHSLMRMWWFLQSRYFTCDQVSLPFAVHKSDAFVRKIDENQYKIPFITLTSHHK